MQSNVANESATEIPNPWRYNRNWGCIQFFKTLRFSFHRCSLLAKIMCLTFWFKFGSFAKSIIRSYSVTARETNIWKLIWLSSFLCKILSNLWFFFGSMWTVSWWHKFISTLHILIEVSSVKDMSSFVFLKKKQQSKASLQHNFYKAASKGPDKSYVHPSSPYLGYFCAFNFIFLILVGLTSFNVFSNNPDWLISTTIWKISLVQLCRQMIQLICSFYLVSFSFLI